MVERAGAAAKFKFKAPAYAQTVCGYKLWSSVSHLPKGEQIDEIGRSPRL
jgi:hypothetical protein